MSAALLSCLSLVPARRYGRAAGALSRDAPLMRDLGENFREQCLRGGRQRASRQGREHGGQGKIQRLQPQRAHGAARDVLRDQCRQDAGQRIRVPRQPADDPDIVGFEEVGIDVARFPRGGIAALLSVPAFAADPAPEGAGPASAEGAAPEAAAETGASESGVEKVVVTATKRPTALQEVPEAITAVDAGFLQSINASSLEEFASFVPSVDFQFFAPGQTRVTVRGISPDEQTGVSTVSYYIDEIAITSSEQRSQPDSHLYDIDRVEFLRGPQGTLYGEGAMGGTIRVITNKPDTHEYSASVRTSLGFIEDGEAEYSADGMVNIPIIEDTLGFRVVLHDRKDGGWIDGIAPIR